MRRPSTKVTTASGIYELARAAWAIRHRSTSRHRSRCTGWASPSAWMDEDGAGEAPFRACVKDKSLGEVMRRIGKRLALLVDA
tara:strand:+ start:856 stop:1104 length:249 start_codon:yes stop_codon:yes gene_type:complete